MPETASELEFRHKNLMVAENGHIEPFTSCFAQLKCQECTDVLTDSLWAAAKLTQDAPVLELSDGLLPRAAELGVIGVGVLLPPRLILALERDEHHLAQPAADAQAWGVQNTHVVAHDIGGAVALRAHLLHGVEYTDLFLWDIVTLDPWGSPFFQLVAENADVFAQLPTNLHSALVKEYIAGAFSHNPSAQEIDVLADPWLDPVGQAAFYQQIAALSAADTRPVVERLESTRCPARIGWGRDDPWVPLRQAYDLQSRLPGTPTVAVLDGVGHLSPCEAPSGVAAALHEWLTRSPQSPGRA